MDINPVIVGGNKDAASTEKSKGAGVVSQEGFSISFLNLLETKGLKFESGLDELMDHTGTADGPDPAEAAESANEHAYSARNTDDNQYEPSDSHDDIGRDRVENPPEESQADSHDDDGRSRAMERGDDHSQSDDPPPAENGPDHQTETANSGTDQEGGGTEQNATDANHNETPGETADDGTDGETTKADGNNPEGEGEAATTAADTETPAPTVSGKNNASEILSGLIEAAATAALPANAADPAQANAQAGSGKENATNGLIRAQEAVGKQAPTTEGLAQQAAAGTPELQAKSSGSTAGNAAAAAGPSGAPSAHGGTQSGNSLQAQQTQTAAADAQANSAPKTNAATAAQAAELSRLVGEGERVSVKVKVASEGASLTSRPGATLASASATAGESQNPGNAGQASNHGNGPQNATAQQAMNLAGQNQNQSQQNGQSGGQAQNTANFGAAVGKAASQGAQSANPSFQSLQSGGSETSATTQISSQDTQNLQKKPVVQTSNPSRPNVPNGGAADQVS
ncbi:MAG: hypothetical protein OEY85_09875, partial [Rhodospirillales bacterium]|nr:hypothetical protein [Rhodospirillales bacterium]